MTRRTLIQSAMPALLSAQAPSDSFRVAITGVGSRGSGLLQNLLKIPNVQIVAICDTTPEHLAAAAKAAQDKGHKPRLYTDYRKMLDEAKDVDGVVIATPVYLHMGMSIAALELGKNVYSEKPMAGTAEECSIVQKAARSAKGIYQVGFQLRHQPFQHRVPKGALPPSILLFARRFRLFQSEDLREKALEAAITEPLERT